MRPTAARVEQQPLSIKGEDGGESGDHVTSLGTGDSQGTSSDRPRESPSTAPQPVGAKGYMLKLKEELPKVWLEHALVLL